MRYVSRRYISLTSIYYLLLLLPLGIYGYPPEKAACVALDTVRRWVQNPINSAKIERIIFCMFQVQENAIYKRLFYRYFPPVPPSPSDDDEQQQQQRNNNSTKDDEEQEHRSPHSQKNTLTIKKVGNNNKNDEALDEEDDPIVKDDSDVFLFGSYR